MRINGFASGMDTDQMVKDLMKAESVPLERMQKEKQELEWKRDDYRSINTLLLDFRNSLSDMRLTTSYRARETSSTNEDLVSVTANSSASQSSFELSKVEQLATSASWTNNEAISGKQLDASQSLSSQSDALNIEWKTGEVYTDKFVGSDDTFTLTNTPDSTEAVSVKVNGQSYKVVDNESALDADSVLLVNNELKFADGTIKSSDRISVEYASNTEESGQYAVFSIGANTSKGETHETFIITGDETLNQVVNKVNNADIGVSMMYDSFSDRVSLRRTETGDFGADEKEISVSGSFMTETLGFNDTNATYSAGQNAKFTINGLETERATNNFQIDGVTFNLKKTFESDEAVTVNVSNDTDAVFDNITEFVDTYNTLIDAINGKATEEYYRDYEPLTDEERSALTDKQQEDWEDRAKSGLLKNDPILRDVLSSMRTDFYAPVNNADSAGTFNQLAAIGITTTSDYMSGGKLEIKDEAKLREAIESDPQGVENLFRGDGDTYEEQGIARRLTDSVNSAMDKINERAGRATYTNQQFTLGRNLDQVEDQIQRFQDRLTQIEDRYWRQFTAMEKAMAQANEQAAYLQQQLGGMMQ
ncbi:flagellar filament capping protein FliD [Gracilibacillus sp. S3-1-1]|uniref:Flagellar filament capping protein FliD n=1 Tax=Gracilibacillus pellucidus TaxID=3095368 RepID=A0ACC6M172_9BACI|nr:flagellar filament capping protein FliD [Gracilibacillus sp. S3-1-1]MDX8044633.1 flagellar filament capping protein FliD [Gracilibacillus sp. S3-1-1]